MPKKTKRSLIKHFFKKYKVYIFFFEEGTTFIGQVLEDSRNYVVLTAVTASNFKVLEEVSQACVSQAHVNLPGEVLLNKTKIAVAHEWKTDWPNQELAWKKEE